MKMPEIWVSVVQFLIKLDVVWINPFFVDVDPFKPYMLISPIRNGIYANSFFFSANQESN